MMLPSGFYLLVNVRVYSSVPRKLDYLLYKYIMNKHDFASILPSFKTFPTLVVNEPNICSV